MTAHAITDLALAAAGDDPYLALELAVKYHDQYDETAAARACECCHEQLPGGNPTQRFCTETCRKRDHARRRRMAGYVPHQPGKWYASDDERLEARRETWRVAGRKKYAKQRAARLAERAEQCA
jgi:hypothetical protein